MRPASHFPKPEIGIAFVAMKRNISDLPKVIQLGKSLKAKYYSISNVQPATQEMQNDRLYVQTIHNIAYMQAPHLPRVSLPKMDFNSETTEALFETFNSQLNVSYSGNNWGGASDTCNFVESGTTIAWMGCQPILASDAHASYFTANHAFQRNT
jgi:hypothetical protein